MARIRTVKPEFWTDERVGECSVSARLLLIGSLNFADDQGGLDRSAKQLKAQVFPYDAIDCEPLVLELIGAGLLVEYEVANRKYLHIKGFRKHQKVENPAKPRIPLYVEPPTPRQSIGESSPSPPLGVAVSSLEGNGREGKVMCAREGDAPPIPDSRIVACVSACKTAWPKGGRENWISGEHLIRTLIAGGEDPSGIESAVQRYAANCKASGRAPMNPSTFFSAEDKPWRQEWAVPKVDKGAGQKADRDAAAWAEAKSRAKAIGFRDPHPAETPTSYMDQVKRAEEPEPSRAFDTSAIVGKLKAVTR